MRITGKREVVSLSQKEIIEKTLLAGRDFYQLKWVGFGDPSFKLSFKLKEKNIHVYFTPSCA